MPRLVTRTPKLCKDRQQAYVKLDGQRIQCGRWGSAEARERYDRLIAEWLANGRELPPPGGADAEASAVTVTQLCVAFWKHVKRRQHLNEQSNYKLLPERTNWSGSRRGI